ncbi:MAG: UpxY family transcription antiterminator [Prevotella sp.]|nr:UpxY family transcription antiterminator [Prevotella sp.]
MIDEEALTVSGTSMPWYGIRLYSSRQEAVGEYFKEHGLEYFIPMQYVDYEDKEGRRQRKLRPVVRNLIFLRKSLPENEMRKLIGQCPHKMFVIRKHSEQPDYYEIPAREMQEFQIMCNPDILMRKYLTQEEAALKAGTPVLVKFGPMKGLTGKLVRSSKKYYLLKEIPGMAVMLKVSRWCCVAMDEK